METSNKVTQTMTKEPKFHNKATGLGITKRAKAGILANDLEAVMLSLSEKQLAFCHEYLVDLKPSQAALRAGYAPAYVNRQAQQLRDNPAVDFVIKALQAKRTAKSDVTKDYVLKKIVDTLEKAEDRDNYTAVLRAAELLAKHLGMFIDRTEISGPDGDAIKIQQKAEEDVADFRSRIARLAERNGESNVVQLPVTAGGSRS